MRRVEREACAASMPSASSAAHQRLGVVGARRGGRPSRSASAARTPASASSVAGDPRHLGRRRRRRRAPGRSSARPALGPAQAAATRERRRPAAQRVDQRDRVGRRRRAASTSASSTSPPAATAAAAVAPSASASRSNSVRNSRKSNSRCTSSTSTVAHAQVVEVDVERRRRARSTITSAFWRTCASCSARFGPQLRRLLVEVGEDAVEAAVGVDQLGRRLLADAGHAGQVVGRVAPQRGVLRVLRRRDAGALDDAGLVVERVVATRRAGCRAP